MKNRKDNDKPAEESGAKYEKKNYFYIGVGAAAASIVAFGLTFSPLKIYALISSVIIALAALSFLNTQKKKNNFSGVFCATAITYVLLAVYVLFFIGGLIYSAS